MFQELIRLSTKSFLPNTGKKGFRYKCVAFTELR